MGLWEIMRQHFHFQECILRKNSMCSTRYVQEEESTGKKPICPSLGDWIGEGNGNPLQYSCWKIPCTEEPGRLQSMGLLRVEHDLTFHFHALEKEMATHSSTLAGKFHGWRSLVGYSPQGHKELDMTEQLHWFKAVTLHWRVSLEQIMWRTW